MTIYGDTCTFQNVNINAAAKVDEELADITQVLSHRFKGRRWTTVE